MLYSEIIAVCSQIHTKHINTLCGQNVPRSKHTPCLLQYEKFQWEFQNVPTAVRKVSMRIPECSHCSTKSFNGNSRMCPQQYEKFHCEGRVVYELKTYQWLTFDDTFPGQTLRRVTNTTLNAGDSAVLRTVKFFRPLTCTAVYKFPLLYHWSHSKVGYKTSLPTRTKRIAYINISVISNLPDVSSLHEVK
jgi:hypothetical protein